MKKVTLLLLTAMITFASCQRTATDSNDAQVTKTVTTRAEASAFITEASAKTTAAGYKYFDLKTKIVDSVTVILTVTGSNQRLAPSFDACGPIYYGGTPINGAVLAAQQAQVDAYYAQGYNCVCSYSYNVQHPGEFIGNQTCVSVTASVTTECPCLSAKQTK